MFLIDDLLMAPGKAVLFVFQELARKAQEELLDDRCLLSIGIDVWNGSGIRSFTQRLLWR